MRFTSALAATAFAFQATAFLVPLEVSEAAAAARGQIESLFTKAKHVYELECPGCPFAGPHEIEYGARQHAGNKLNLEFDIDASQRLRINGQPVFPMDINDAQFIALTASRSPSFEGEITIPMRLGFALEAFPPVINDDTNPGAKLIPLQFTIFDVQGQPVEVDTVKIEILEITTETGNDRHIAKIEAISFASTPGTNCPSDGKWSLCRLRAIIAARLQALVESAKAHAHKASSWVGVKGGCRGKNGSTGHKSQDGVHKHHGHGHHGHHRHHTKFQRIVHRINRILHQTLRFFVIPAMLGVVGGLMASAVGMLAGQLIVYAWIRFGRGGQRGHIRLTDAASDDEKDGLMGEVPETEKDAPPAYGDVDPVTLEEKY